MTVADAACRNAYAGWEPSRPPPTNREFCPRTRLPGGPLKGSPYDPATDPVQSWLIDQLDSGRWRRVYWAAPPQIAGKTQCAIIVPAMRAAICLKAAVGYGLPTLHDLDRGWQTKVAPTIRDAGLGDYLPQRGPGSKGGRPPSVAFEDPENDRAQLGGFVFLAGGAKQVTCRVIVVDEIDAWRTAEGDPRWTDLEDVWARADSFQDAAIRIGVGTVECDDPARSIILHLVQNEATGHRLHARCPHCGTYAPMEWDNWTYEYRLDADGKGADDSHAGATAAYACPSCAVRWTEDDRRSALLAARFPARGQTVDAAGIIQGPEPRGDALGLRTHALDCILTTMAEQAKRHSRARFALEAHGNHEPLRKFWRYSRVEGYAGDQASEEGGATTHDARSLAARTGTAWATPIVDRTDTWSRVRASDMPPALAHRVAAVDVQRDRIYWSGIGADGERRTYDLAWGTEYGAARRDGEDLKPWIPGDLPRTLQRMSEVAAECMAGLDVGVVDVSDGKTQDDVVQFLSANRGRWKALQGVRGLPRERPDGTLRHLTPILAWDSKWRGIGSYIIDTDPAQQAVANALMIVPESAGAAIIPGPLKSNDAYIQHMTSTTWVVGKNNIRSWKKIRERNDFLDCRAYATSVIAWRIISATSPPRRQAGKIGSFL